MNCFIFYSSSNIIVSIAVQLLENHYILHRYYPNYYEIRSKLGYIYTHSNKKYINLMKLQLYIYTQFDMSDDIEAS